ncbi:thioesterase family protein [Apibacter sp. HY039]|uniref:acyl-CoA thioesterase n=1 Tax=Apibacter sp. HY039 TaxID=2501476 RepID=UPI000FEB8C4B|nr:thioesterase family protein [Apibacter sp. HY039]
MKYKLVNSFFWGNSVALSWLWGLGLFFSVQMTFLFGLTGLFSFAFLNALGLFMFGYGTQKIAQRDKGQESLERFFKRWSKPFRLSLYLYQLLAVALTIFAIVNYLLRPLLISYWPGWDEQGSILQLFTLLLVVALVLSAACLVGEEFTIKSIKYWHLLVGILIAVIASALLLYLQPQVLNDPVAWITENNSKPIFWGYMIPILIGFFVGPWLDLQQWQRAIQMRKENTNIASGYFFGALLFFLFLIFHGVLASYVFNSDWFTQDMASVGLGGLTYGHEMIVNYMVYFHSVMPWWVPAGYYCFIALAVLTTLDSGYVATKWFLKENSKTSNNPVLSMIPSNIIDSPIVTYLTAALIAVFGVLTDCEIEYFMVFYATFFVAYAALGIARCFVPNSQHSLPQVKLFSIGAFSLVVFASGYFMQVAWVMIMGSILPIFYVIWLVLNTDLLRVVKEKVEEVMDAASEIPVLRTLSKATQTVINGKTEEVSTGSHFEGKWFVHSFMATYADTNSVGNVYFGVYALWVGKTRELFFNYVLPDFNLKDTTFLILTRSFEHKYINETREFEKISVKIRASEYNRKFATLEHQVFDSAGNLLGKGKQQLIFVSPKDYKILDIPPDVIKAFMPYM